jgi:chromosome segregation ATPase
MTAAPDTVRASLETLRAEMASDIVSLERIGEEVIQLRRRFRSALQQIDLLERRLAEKDDLLAERDALIVSQAALIERLTRDVERLEGERLALVPPPGGAE